MIEYFALLGRTPFILWTRLFFGCIESTFPASRITSVVSSCRQFPSVCFLSLLSWSHI